MTKGAKGRRMPPGARTRESNPITEFPTQCTVPVNARTKTSLNIRNIEYIFDLSELYKCRIEKALDLLNRELVPNYKAIAVTSASFKAWKGRQSRRVSITTIQS